MRTRRSPGKDKQNASHNSTSNPSAKVASYSASPPGDDEQPARSESSHVAVDLSSPTPDREGRKRKADTAAAEPSPTRKRPVDLERQLFDDADDENVEPAAVAIIAGAASTQASNSATKVESDSVDSVLTSRKRSRRAGTEDSQIESQPSSASFHTAFETDQTPQVNTAAAAASTSNATDAASLQLRIRQLEMQLADSKAKAKQDTELITAQHTIFQDLRGQCICHICLDPSFRPCVLAPCGHVFCINCLRSWFTKPLASEPAPPENWSQAERERYQRSRTLKRKKICPSCRTELACPPVEVYLVRDMLEKVDAGLKLSKEANNVDADLAESSTAILDLDDKARSKAEDLPKGFKVWEDIFDEDGPRRIIFDEVDGVARCGSCGSEIFDGACSNPSCAIEYDSHSDYEDLRRGGWDDVGEFDTDMDSDDGGPYGMGGRSGRYANGPLQERLRRFEDRHGRSEDVRRGAGNRLELPDDFSGITYMDSDGEEHVVEDHTERYREMRRRQGDGGRAEVVLTEDEELEVDEEDEEMDDFIVDDDEGGEMIRRRFNRPASSIGSDSEDDSRSNSEEDDLLPGPRSGGRDAAIEISDSSSQSGSEEEEDDDERRSPSVEYRGRGRRAGVRVVDDDEDSEGRDSESEEQDEVMHSESSGDDDDDEEEEGESDRERNLGSSTDSSARRRRTRIIDDEDE